MEIKVTHLFTTPSTCFICIKTPGEGGSEDPTVTCEYVLSDTQAKTINTKIDFGFIEITD